MKQTVHLEDFKRSFKNIRPDNFSHEGLNALYENLIQYEDDTGEELNLDIIAICCDYSEFKSLKDFQKNYNDVYQSIEDIEDATDVIQIPDSEAFIIRNF
jgi:hypothetical protein